MEGGFHHLSKEMERVFALEFASCNHREDAFGESDSFLRLVAKANFSPLHGMPLGSLGSIVCRLDPLMT